MNQRLARKVRKEYRTAMAARAAKDTRDLQIFLAQKSTWYRFKLSMKILFKIGVKHDKNKPSNTNQRKSRRP